MDYLQQMNNSEIILDKFSYILLYYTFIIIFYDAYLEIIKTQNLL